MRASLKDWAVIVDALGRGDQILVLRKGGVHEDTALFQPEHDRFWLFPTLFHQQKELVIPAAQARFEDSVRPSLNDQTVPVQFLAELHSAIQITSLDAAHRLAGQHIWSSEAIGERFEWGGQKSIYALLLRVFQLPSPVRLKRLPEYGGCRSWIELSEDVSEQGLEPVISNDAFNMKADAAMNALNQHAKLP